MAKIIIAAPPITGELSPLLELGRGLARRGHQITVVTGSRFRTEAEGAGLGFSRRTRLRRCLRSLRDSHEAHWRRSA
jgi:UDP:flavonoid glycosyltransferase YjiC (YdhE family)